jgi:very-short-patch-repair endonuclease
MTEEVLEPGNNMSDRAIQLVDYMTALARINSKIIRSHDEYTRILWVHTVPDEPDHCFTQAWGPVEEQEDEWLKVVKFDEPELPKIPVNCTEWADLKELRDLENLPELKESIVVKRVVDDPETGEEYTTSETRYLEDYQGIQEEWDKYVEEKWLPWKALYERHYAVQKVYAELFHIYQEQQKLGEQYELVFCSGLLSWKTPTGHETQRHAITAKATIEFEPHLGKFTVKPAVDGDPVELELGEMLDVEVLPQNIQTLKENCRDTIGTNFWSRSEVDTVLSAAANSLAETGNGEYRPKIFKPEVDKSTKKPIIEFAPALILRKRSLRGLEQLLSSMREQIEEGGSIPAQFLDLCECLGEEREANPVEVQGPSVPLPPEEIYFPLPANDEQRQIIRTLDYQHGVLVQGPPGTGKSHTITNLICHLLATGKRVLVTAKTPRALQVLHDKLPKEIRPLCINLLGQGAEERESLGKSVAGILKRIDNQNISETSRQIKELKERIETNRRDKATTERKLIALREDETYEHTVAGGRFTGTAATIARELRKQEAKYSWFTDEVSDNDHLPLSTDEVNQLAQLIGSIDSETENDLSRDIPDKLHDPQIVRNIFKQEKESHTRIHNGRERAQSQTVQFLIAAGEDIIKNSLKLLGEFYADCQTVRQRPQKWIELAVVEVLTDKDLPWSKRLKLSKESVEGIRELIDKVDKFTVFIPDGTNRKQILSSAQVLKKHFDSGGKTGLLMFKPKILRDHGPVLEKVQMNGMPGNSPEVLGDLIDYLTVEQGVEYAWSVWADREARSAGPLPLQVAEIDELNESLERVVDLYERRNSVQALLQNISGLRDPRWADLVSLESLINDCRIALAGIQYEAIAKKLNKFETWWADWATRPTAHPVVQNISDSIKERDAEAYAEYIHLAEGLVRKSQTVIVKRTLIGKLAEKAPDLAGHCAGGIDRELWSERLQKLSDAWAWAQGNTWLSDFLDSDVDSLERHLRAISDKIRNDIADLAALKSWDFCFSRMTKFHREHLMGWQQAMKRVGKGTGKYAHTFRKQAQQHLNKCRDAVPAWIMPLHRVYESVAANPGIFDVIIVDEASQCGPEGLPLLYLGKKVLVVGDDKQISPEAVGVNKAQIQQLMRNHLNGFEHADSFDIDSSLFDHGRIRFSNRISLREHFRCMPEIIRFSNDLCYREAPLVPLRQFSPDRLEPLKSHFVSEGYREGSGAKVINKPEAEAVVQAIEECCKDEKYQGMTMGVIVLQGEAQGYLIQEMLLKKLGAEEMESRRLICGNPYSFQGDERDVVFLSMVAAPGVRITSLTKETDQRRFNVAASRAQEQMFLFYSAGVNDLGKSCYRRRLLDHFLDPTSHITRSLGEDAELLRDKAYRANRQIENPPDPFDSWFEVDVALKIAARGYRAVPQFKFADKIIDIVVQGGEAQLAVECDGDYWHGRDAYAADMQRQRKLERCGWTFFRVRESYYYANPDQALEPLWDLLERMGITPLTEDSSDADTNTFGMDDIIEDDSTGIADFAQEAEGSDDDLEDGDSDEGEPEPVNESDPEGELEALKEILLPDTEGGPKNIQEALAVKPGIIRDAIIQVLNVRPNNSTPKKDVPKYILKMWEIRTRNTPREMFIRRVNDQLAIMKRKGYVVIYTATNVRVKLGHVEYPGSN